MNHSELHNYFSGVGVKRLTAVETEPETSNQHEINTPRDMCQKFLGENHKREFPTRYIWLGEEQDGFTAEGTTTHYDARKQQDHRAPEWRLYYDSNPVTEGMRENDILFLAMTKNGDLYFIVAQEGSTSERQLFWLFDLQHPSDNRFVSHEITHDGQELNYTARFIFDEIGIEIEYEDPDTDKLDSIVKQFGSEFPTTSVFSALARNTLPKVRAEDDPDKALVMWLDHEEALFRRLERRIIEERLKGNFLNEDGEIDVDEFIQYSLSVHNRRKSRRGRSIENHLEAVFHAHNIAYVRGAVTENNQRPDFLFPSEKAYREAPESGHACLTMLGAKSTCKDRWRQVLAEASKIPKKHLLTVEPGITERQTTQMENSDLQLVVPQSIQESYSDKQRGWLWNLDDFIRDVSSRARK